MKRRKQTVIIAYRTRKISSRCTPHVYGPFNTTAEVNAFFKTATVEGLCNFIETTLHDPEPESRARRPARRMTRDRAAGAS